VSAVAIGDCAGRGHRQSGADILAAVAFSESGGISGSQAARGNRGNCGGGGGAVVCLGVGCRRDGDGTSRDHTGGVVGENDKIVIPAVSVRDYASGGERQAGADVLAAVALGERGGVAGHEGARGDGRSGGGGSRAVVALAVGGRCHGDGPL